MTPTTVRSGPEVLFDIEPAEVSDSAAWSSMPVGPWLAGPDGRTAAGSLGVLVDHVLGMALIGERPGERWSVSSEITIDVFAGLATASGPLRADAITVDRDGIGAFATGTVVDDRGRLVAVASQRGRHVPAGRTTFDTGYRLEPTRRDADLIALLGLEPAHDGWTLPLSPAVLNPLGRLHGGVTLAAVDVAATSALAGSALATAGLRVHYRRPVEAEATLRLRAVVEHRGRSSAVVRVDGEARGRTCVSATVTAGPAQ